MMAITTLQDLTSKGLVNAIKAAAPGDIIQIPYCIFKDDFILDGANSGGITIRPLDKRYRPVFAQRFYIKNSTALTFDGLECSVSFDMPMQLINCSNIIISHWYIHGQPDNIQRGLLVRVSNNCLIVQNTLELLSDAIGWLDSPHMTLRQNVFIHIKDNAMAGGGAVNMEIGGNIASDFRRPADDNIHPDFIQNWGTVNNPQPTNILIRSNIFVRGEQGALVQGIWISDAKELDGTIKYPGTVKIYDNITIGTVYNGMVVNNSDIAEFSGNICLATEAQWNWLASNIGPTSDGQGHKLPGPTNAKVRFKNNIACRFNETVYGNPFQGNGAVTVEDQGGNIELACLPQELADQLYQDYNEIFVENGSWAVGFYDKYRTRILERLGL
jgi:hypothetical protein